MAHRLLRCGLVFGWAVALLAGCGGATHPGDDAAVDAARDSVLPPDLNLDDGSKPATIGEPCDPAAPAGGCGGAVCLDVGHGVGVCARPKCTAEDSSTPATEDDCPAETACATLPVDVDGETVMQTFCLPRCVPSATANPCIGIHPGLACDPLSLLVTGHTEVCLLPACTVNTDCGSGDPIKPDARCDTASGLCFNLGDPQRRIGDPCKTAKECGPGQDCLTEQRIGDAVKVTGGYCTVIGCKYRGPWECPAESTCIGLGSDQELTICLATDCDPAKPPESDGCRDEAPTGQYDCLDVDSQGVCWLDITPD